MSGAGSEGNDAVGGDWKRSEAVAEGIHLVLGAYVQAAELHTQVDRADPTA